MSLREGLDAYVLELDATGRLDASRKALVPLLELSADRLDAAAGSKASLTSIANLAREYRQGLTDLQPGDSEATTGEALADALAAAVRDSASA